MMKTGSTGRIRNEKNRICPPVVAQIQNSKNSVTAVAPNADALSELQNYPFQLITNVR
ncbi:MAG: hypothetical protein LBG47_08885 [Prevotellaceae bacterium]|jgi:hypothetical protein|nr:hypothetical protein [Prevotellaceae bacterium]